MIHISLDDVETVDPELAADIRKNTKRYALIFADAIDAINTQPTRDVPDETVLDMFIRHRQILADNAAGLWT